MELKIDRQFKKMLKGSIEDYEFEIGILKNAQHREPMSYDLHGSAALTTYAGGKARRATREKSKTDLNYISKKFRKSDKYLTAPFSSRKNKEIVDFVKEFWEVVRGRTKPKRLVNLLQAIVRNPILRQDYGKNSHYALDRKGFNRYMIDTAQFFKAIRANVFYRGRHV